MPEFRTITIGHAAEENLMYKAQKPAGYVDESELMHIGGDGLNATLWRDADGSTGEKRIAVFTDPSEELQLLRGRVAMLEKYEPECLRLIREAEAERDLLKDQNTKFEKLLLTACQFLYSSCLTEEIAHADESFSVLKAARAARNEVVHSGLSDSTVMLDYLASKIAGKTISVDMSTGDHDVGNRIFCTVAELMRDGDSFTILAEDPKANYTPAEELLQVEAERDAKNAQKLQIELAIRRFIGTYAVTVDGSSDRNHAVCVLASFVHSPGDEPLTAFLAEAGESDVARLYREVEQLHASAETVHEVLMTCMKDRNALRYQVGMALLLAKDAAKLAPNAYFAEIINALSAPISEVQAVQGNAASLSQVSAAEPDQPKPEFAALIGLQMRLLDWNRAQPTPPITLGYEYGVAGAVLDMLMPADTQMGRVLRQVVTSALGAGSDVPST
jgi:hypothetical protein